MTAAAPHDAPAARIGRIRLAGALLVAGLTGLVALAPAWTAPLREAWFDALQRAMPRAVDTMPATVVEIDARSLAAIGRWPWPRSVLAELVERIAAQQPAALALDILMPEPDPLSPERLLRDATPAAAAALAALPANDALLARALAAAPSVLAVAGMPEPTGMTLRAPSFVVQGSDDAASLPLLRYPGALASVEPINAAAAGWGLVSVDAPDGVVRRLPLVAEVGGTLVPALAVEMVRVAARARALRLVARGAAVHGLAIGETLVATEPDAHVRVHFSPRHAARFVSAADVLQGRADGAALRHKLVLVAATGLGLGDYHVTALGERMPGAEIHAQLLESLFDGTLLQRPPWAAVAEAAAVALLGALVVWATPLWTPRAAAAVALGSVVGVLAVAWGAFAAQRLLLDAATPAAGAALAFGAMLVMTLGEATRHRRALERVVQRQREHAARVAGELDAARRIQMASLPHAALLADEPRVDVAAAMQTAREVGGDLYDFFRLDGRHLFFLIGDVAGKGLPASIFMAVSKALCKSAALRAGLPDAGDLMSTANAEISRDNRELLFVSAFAGVLDLDTGVLAYCNAGHDNPLRLPADGSAPVRVTDGDGPPLCVVDGHAYRGATLQMQPGEALCLVTDGVSEAHDRDGALYGSARLETLLRALPAGSRDASAIVEAIRDGVASFVRGAEASDDLTVLVVRWRGRDARA